MKLQFILTKTRKGFSIVEVAVAMGVVTLMLTTFLGIYGPAQKNVQRAISSQDANAMKDQLSNELAVLRTSETGAFNNSFGKAVDYIINSHEKDAAVLVYRYRALPEDDLNDTDGILPAYADKEGIPGRDYIVQTAVRKRGKDDALIDSELSPLSVDGPVFVVRMTQLISGNSASDLILNGDVDVLKDPDDGTPIATADEYEDAVIAFRAEFFRLPSNLAGYVQGGDWQFEDLGKAVVETNIAIRR